MSRALGCAAVVLFGPFFLGGSLFVFRLIGGWYWLIGVAFWALFPLWLKARRHRTSGPVTTDDTEGKDPWTRHRSGAF